MDKYDLGALVGKGSFGSVLLVRRRSDGRPFVMKRLPLSGLSGASMDSYRTEIQLLSELEHPCIVSYMESFVDRAGMELCIVMQFCENGDLAAFIKGRQQSAGSGSGGSNSAGSASSSGCGAKLSESLIKSYFIQMCLALHYMHEKNILHRDLKTGNIFLTAGHRRLQLGDFGISKVLGGAAELANTMIGTPYYMSPELFKNKPYNHKSDVWALGCILYELTSLKHAFDAGNLNGLATKVIQGVYPPIATSYSRDLRDLIKSMLGVTPSSRPSVKQILLMPTLFQSIRKYIRSIVLQPQQDAETNTNEDGESNSGGFRPAHVLNLRNQLDRLGPPLSGIFPEMERERAEKKSSGLPAAPSSSKASKAAASSAAAASDLYDGADGDVPDAIDRTLVAGAAAVPGSHPPTIRRSRRQHQRQGSNGRPAKQSEGGASDDSPIAAAPAAAPGVGRHKGLQSRLAALDREHALRLEELRAEEEAKRKLEQDFERLQALQAQRAKNRIQQGRRAGGSVGARPAAAADASIASTASTSSAGSTASASAAANLPIIAASSIDSISPVSPPAPMPVSFTSSMAALPSLSSLGLQQQPAQPMSSRESSRHASPALGPHRVNNKSGANRMPAMVLGAPVVATGAHAGIGRSPSPAPPLHGGYPSASPTGGAGGAGTASGSNSAAPSPRFASRRLAAAVAGGAAASTAAAPPASNNGDESKESGSSNFRSASPRTISASPQPPSASAAPSIATDENRHLKLLKRKAALKAAPGQAASSPSEGSAARSPSQMPSPELGSVSASAPPPRMIAGIASVPLPASRVTGGAGRPRVAHPIMVPLSSAAPSSSPAAAAAAAVLSPGSVLESEVAAERAELARLRVERERLEDLLTKMDDVLFDGQLEQQQPMSAIGGAKSPYSGSAEIDTPTHGSASAPPAVSTAQRSSGPVLHSPPSGSGSGGLNGPSSFSASTILPSAFDAPLQYRGRVAAAPAGAAAASVALKQRRRHSAQNAGLILDTAAAQSVSAQQQAHPYPSAPPSIAPRHRTFVHPSAASGGPVSGFPPHSVFSPAAAAASSAAGPQSSSRDRDRVLALKASRKSDVEAAESVRLLAARREYFTERAKADQRTKDFYGNGPAQSNGSHRSPSPGASPPPPPDADPMQRHQSDPLSSYPAARYQSASASSASAASAAAAAIAADNLLIYDDRHLHLHLNTDLSPTAPGPSRAPAAGPYDRDQLQLPSHCDSSTGVVGSDDPSDPSAATVREFQAHLAQYTRRIETLRSAIEVSASALGQASRGLDRGHLMGAAATDSAGEPSDGDASDDDDDEGDDDDDPERSGSDDAAYADDSEGPSAAPPFNLAERRAALAAECVSLLGRSAFIAAYDFLVDAQSDPDYANDSLDDARKVERLTAILGADRVKHWKLIDQLIFMESC